VVGGFLVVTFDADFVAEVLDFRTGNIADLPQIGPNKFSLPIVAKSWPDFYKEWGVWFNPSQDPIDDVSSEAMMTNRGHMANLAQSSGSFRDVVWRTAYWSSKRQDIAAISLVYSNSYLDATGEHDGLNTIFVTAAVEYNGANIPVLFSGEREATLAPGALIKSDLTTFAVPKNTMFWVRQNVRTANATEKYATGYVSVAALGEGFSTVTPLAQVDAVGVLGTAQVSNMFGPVAILGKSLESGPPHVAILGSSSAFGTGENFATLPDPGDRGYLSRLISNNFGQTVLAAGSNSLAQWVADSSRRMAVLAAIRPTHVVCQLGANDILNGSPAATIQSRLQGMWDQLSAAGYRVIQTTFTPSSTGTWTTLAGQTATFATTRAQVNGFIRGVPPPLVGVLDVCALTESSPGSGLWRIDGGAWTADGTHTTRHADIATSLSISVFG
jgi:GDSL-like lipase/acylhydrolase family protein